MKTFRVILFFSITLLISCGPSAVEIAKEKAKQDSILEVAIRKKIADEQRALDSIAEMNSLILDSIAGVEYLRAGRNEKMDLLKTQLKNWVININIELQLSKDRLKEVERNTQHLSYDEKEAEKRKVLKDIAEMEDGLSMAKEVLNGITNNTISDEKLTEVYYEFNSRDNEENGSDYPTHY